MSVADDSASSRQPPPAGALPSAKPGWVDRRSPTRPQFVKGWRKAVEQKVAAAQATPATGVKPSGRIDIWIADPDVLIRAESSLKLLDADDWAVVHRLQDPSQRRNAMAARVVLRIALSQASGHKIPPSQWRFGLGPNQRPVVAEGLPQIKFSTSHVDQVVVVAVSADRDVGIDIECIDQNLSKGLIAGFLHLDEEHSVGGLPRPQEIREFIRLWTLKEAYTKLLGVGHLQDFKTIKFTLDPVKLNPKNDKAGSTQFENFYLSSNHLLFYAALAIRHPPHDQGTTDVQIISLAGGNGNNNNTANNAAPLAG